MARTYNLFISHSWKYSNSYERLVKLLHGDRRFSFRNYSVPRLRAVQGARSNRALREAICHKMRPCHIIIVMAGVYATYSEWINEEIEIATCGFREPKPILAIKPRGNVNVSSVVSENADLTVNWDTASVVDAIRHLASR